MKLVKILLLLLVIGGIVYVAANYTGGESTAENTRPARPGDAPIGVEEKYGFTSQTVGN